MDAKPYAESCIGLEGILLTLRTWEIASSCGMIHPNLEKLKVVTIGQDLWGALNGVIVKTIRCFPIFMVLKSTCQPTYTQRKKCFFSTEIYVLYRQTNIIIKYYCWLIKYLFKKMFHANCSCLYSVLKVIYQ